VENDTRGQDRDDPGDRPSDLRPLAPSTLDDALYTLLATHPEALVMALDDGTVRVPLPDDARFADCPPFGETNAMIVEFVVPHDRMTVVRTWERARVIGLAQEHVRLAAEPDRYLALTIVDARHRHGVWIVVILPDDGWEVAPSATVDASLMIPSRPRTATIHKNLSAVITHIDDRTTRLLGWPPEEMIGHRSLDFIHPDDHDRAIGQWLEMQVRQQSQRIRIRHRHRDGNWVWLEMENVFVGLDSPDRLVALAELTDISDEMAAHEAVSQRERLFRRLAESLPVGVLQTTADGRVVFVNARLAELMGVTDATTVDEQFATVRPEHRLELNAALKDAATSGHDRDAEVDIERPGDAGHRRYLFTVAALSGQEGETGAIVSVTDISDGARLREELRHQATSDALTGCLNRAATLAALERQLGDPGKVPLAVVFIDLNRFKSVNDSYGHAVGDELLAVAARRLRNQARSSDLVGRIGGDEFLVVCPRIGDRDQALALGRRFQRRLQGRTRISGVALRTSASIGVALAGPGTSADLLVAQADAAMYTAKREGGEEPVLFDV
jgi:diguanylate cyclase (GGDEF)-like protein/PAS domain S-box-containing protein